MTREECVEKLNNSFKDGTINAQIYLELLSEFLAEKHPDKAEKIMTFVISQPIFISQTTPTVVSYLVGKFGIFILNKVEKNVRIPINYY